MLTIVYAHDPSVLERLTRALAQWRDGFIPPDPTTQLLMESLFVHQQDPHLRSDVQENKLMLSQREAEHLHAVREALAGESMSNHSMHVICMIRPTRVEFWLVPKVKSLAKPVGAILFANYCLRLWLDDTKPDVIKRVQSIFKQFCKDCVHLREPLQRALAIRISFLKKDVALRPHAEILEQVQLGLEWLQCRPESTFEEQVRRPRTEDGAYN